MFFQHVYDETLAQGSYVIGCQQNGEAIVIDARRDIDIYLEIAKKNNLKITKITETHIHADFLCGSRELAELTGAEMLLSDEGGEGWLYEFPHTGLKDGDVIKIGNLSIEVMHTPGHTPESISFLLTDHPSSDEPVMFFSGDFVFVGDVGRPDLLEKAAGIKNTMEAGARDMFNSLKRFKSLPDYVQVWPGHGAGSACGKSLGAVPSSTVGYEKLTNWALRYSDDEEQEFVKMLLTDQPEPPKYFAMMKHLNKSERNLLTQVPDHPKLSKEEFLIAYKEGVKILDTREKDEFAEGFVPGSFSITGNKSFSTWAGWFLDYKEPFILIANDNKIDELTRKLMRVGLDNLKGYIENIDDLGLDKGKINMVTIEELKDKYLNNPAYQVVDVRGASEFKSGHIEGVENIFVGTLPDNLDKISREKEVVIFCQSGARTCIANSILQSEGFTNIKNFVGGMQEWNLKNNPVVKG